jgi:glutathione S-transferase
MSTAGSLTLHFHPLSSFCHKVLIALYENDTPFTPNLVNLRNDAERNALRKLWPMGKFPVLQDHARDRSVAESSIIIDYLDEHYPGKTRLVPADRDLARQVRFRDRFFDLYVHLPMQKIVGDRLRPVDKKDAHGVEEARTQMMTALTMVDQTMTKNTWATGETFSMADCAAAPALFYAEKVMPFGTTHPNAAAYLQRLKERPSYARTLKEAEPYFKYYPKESR